ncbi:FGGY family carbohydrate kinase [Pseudomarimonas arenosa]|uniref:glycerol kinase n=1 Tax=Pseudomarimonas arenosa TaxID=2774145 RepID=A0AAW3ZPG4_9GAMM|nr:glycerol kinase [Pseudomarimonas arenosa]MBD8527405.1 glycerol kinase [Pseudomarimonas arenosa]
MDTHSPDFHRPPSGDLLIGLDQGTTGSTALLIDRDLNVLARATVEFPQHFPQPGWVEHEHDDIWVSVRSALKQVLEGVDPTRLAALGITNQRETTFVWDADSGIALGRAVVWQDRRTSQACAELKIHEEDVRARTGLPIDPYFSATKIAWLRRQHGTRRLAFGTADTHLARRLCGASLTDLSNASRTLLLDLRQGIWCEHLTQRFDVAGIERPLIVPSSGVCGRIRGVPELPDGLPLAGIAGDQQAALFGQGCFDAGQAKISYGTGSFILLNTGPFIASSRHGLLSTVAWQLGGETQYALEGGAFVAGALVSWLRDGLGIIERASEVEALARSVPDSGGVTIVPAHAGLGAPHWRPDARGVIHGLTRGTTRAHIARAALEGIAHSQCDILEAMAADHGAALTDLRVDGGAAANDLLMQIQSDFCGLNLQRPRMLETTALGAAMLAGLGVGLWSGLDELRRSYPLDRRFEPAQDPAAVAQARQRWKEIVARA